MENLSGPVCESLTPVCHRFGSLGGDTVVVTPACLRALLVSRSPAERLQQNCSELDSVLSVAERLSARTLRAVWTADSLLRVEMHGSWRRSEVARGLDAFCGQAALATWARMATNAPGPVVHRLVASLDTNGGPTAFQLACSFETSRLVGGAWPVIGLASSVELTRPVKRWLGRVHDLMTSAGPREIEWRLAVRREEIEPLLVLVYPEVSPRVLLAVHDSIGARLPLPRSFSGGTALEIALWRGKRPLLTVECAAQA